MTGARQELDRALDFFDGIDEALAVRIVTHIKAKADWPGAFPTTGAPFAAGLRKSLVSGTPYLIIYRIRSTAVEILRVRHAAEDRR